MTLVMLLITAHCALRTDAASVQSGSAFLRIDAAAKPAAMAGAYTAQAGDLNILAYNPGGLAAMDRSEVSFTHAEWLQGTRYDYLAYGQTTSVGTFGLSATRLGYGDLERRDTQRQMNGSFGANDSAYELAYGSQIGTRVGLGGAFKYIRRTIDSDHASSYAMDFGGVGRVPGLPLRIGASVLNIGPGMKFDNQTDPLPLTLAVGAAYVQDHTLTWTADLDHEPNDQRTTVKTGFEYKPVSAVALRAGYQFPVASTGDPLWSMDNVRGGLGIAFSRFRIDYALAPFGELGLTHRFTVDMTFGAPAANDHNILKPTASNERLLMQIDSSVAQLPE